MKCPKCNGAGEYSKLVKSSDTAVDMDFVCNKCGGEGIIIPYAEQEIKAMATPNIIKKMVELAEGVCKMEAKRKL